MATIPHAAIQSSLNDFDLTAPLTDEELQAMGMLATLPNDTERRVGVPLLKDLDEEDDTPPVDVVLAVTDENSYNVLYAHYLRCQALAALVAFEEGWKSFEELVLKAYVQQRRAENKEYKGDDPNKAFSLRIREQTAEDFVKFIKAVVAEAVSTKKPVLTAKR